MRPKLNSLPISCGIAVLAGGIFALDVWLPIGMAVGVLSVIPVLLSMWSSRRRFTFLVATGGSVRTLLVFFLTPFGTVSPLCTEHLKGFGNRALSLATIWATATGVHRYKRAEATLLQTARTTRRVEDEGWRVRKDGSRLWVDVVLTALHNEAVRLFPSARELSETRLTG